MPGDRSVMPPLRLPSQAELARQALAAPLLARAVRLARRLGDGVPVGADGQPEHAGLTRLARELGVDGDPGGLAATRAAWRLAAGTGLLRITAEDGTEAGAAPDGSGRTGPAGRRAVPGEQAARVTGGGPREILELWRSGLETVLTEAETEAGTGTGSEAAGGGEGEGTAAGSGAGAAAPDRPSGEAAGTLGRVLAALYVLTALEGGGLGDPERSFVPLPALAATVVVPEDMAEPTDAVLEEVSEEVMRLDRRFRLLEPLGLVEYRPVDEALIEELDGPGEPADGTGGGAAGDGGGGTGAGRAAVSGRGDAAARYGMVRLTALGAHGVRARLLDAGITAPLTGDLAGQGAETLLDTVTGYPEAAARDEVEEWLDRRDPVAAARELLAAGRGDDPAAPLRRLGCQQALALIGREAEPALREVLDDRHLGGLARVWLAEHGATGVPEPSEEMVFWLTVDTLAAQLGADGDSAELEELVLGLVGQHGAFFDTAWRVDHPATGEVLEAMGRLHPDRAVAKAARQAAYKARSRGR